MPVLSFTPADALQTTLAPAAAYTCCISKIEGPKPSNSGKGVNYFIDIQITEDGPMKGKELTIAASSGSKGALDLLGAMQWSGTSVFLLLEAAINGHAIKAENQTLDTDELLHKPFDAAWGVATVEGKMVNVVNSFAPAGKLKAGGGVSW